MATQASGKLEQKSTRCRTIPYQTHVAPLLYCVITCVVRRAFLAFLPPTHAQERPWAAYAGTRVWPSIIGRVFERAAVRILAGRCKGKKGREWVSGGADRLAGGLLLGGSKRRPHLWDRRGFGAGEPSVGAALPGKLDGLERSASTVLLGEKRSPGASSLSMFCAEMSEPQSPVFMHCQGPVGIACSQTRRCLRFRLAALAFSRCERGTWHFSALTPQLLR